MGVQRCLKVVRVEIYLNTKRLKASRVTSWLDITNFK